MAYDESEMRIWYKRIVTPREPQGVKQYHWNTWALENHQLKEYKQITNMAFDESEMRTWQKRIVTPGEPQGVKTVPLKYQSIRKPPVERVGRKTLRNWLN